MCGRGATTRFPAPHPSREASTRRCGGASSSPAGCTCPSSHDILQAAMGWTNSHLHSFTYRRRALWHARRRLSRGGARRDGAKRLQSRSAATCAASSTTTTSATRWEHEVVVEDVTWSPFVLEVRCVPRRPERLSARGRGRDRRAMRNSSRPSADPLHEEHDSYLVWVGLQVRPRGVRPGGGQRRAAARSLIRPFPFARSCASGSSRSRSR